ncbi:hypothetical protein BD560DRAFT_399948 [Blakeslea trispora]|nr:hypothetical protein BD560DRAFT_399948 [Blakeslea trispora]
MSCSLILVAQTKSTVTFFFSWMHYRKSKCVLQQVFFRLRSKKKRKHVKDILEGKGKKERARKQELKSKQ